MDIWNDSRRRISCLGLRGYPV